MNELQEMPDTIGRMTALEHLTLDNCSKLRTLPASIMHLSRLKTLCIWDVPLEDMPCIEALTAMHELRLDVADYALGSRAFTALSRSLPCLQQLQVLGLGASGVVALQAGDVLAIGRALKAWPLPLLHDVGGNLRLSPYSDHEGDVSSICTAPQQRSTVLIERGSLWIPQACISGQRARAVTSSSAGSRPRRMRTLICPNLTRATLTTLCLRR